MAMEETKPMETFRTAQADFDRAWQDVEGAVLKLQEATEKARQSLSNVSPQLALDLEGWRVLDPLLYLEELSLDAGWVVDKVKRKIEVPAQDDAQGKKGRR